MKRIMDIIPGMLSVILLLIAAMGITKAVNTEKEAENLRKQITKVEQDYKELSIKADSQKAQAEAKEANMRAKIDELNANIVTLEAKNKELQTENTHLTLKLEEATPCEPEEEPAEEAEIEPYKVGAISVMKLPDDRGGITEIDYEEVKSYLPTGPHLTPEGGVFEFEGHTETYYNLDMSVVVQVAQSRGIAGEYWVREDGCKMLGDYIMVAACYDIHPYVSLVNTSLGMGIVVDTGGFTAWNAYNIDISCAW